MTVDDIPAANWATLDREFFAYVARNEWKLAAAFKPKPDRGPNVSRYPHVPAGPIIRYAKTVTEQLHPRKAAEPG